MNRIDRYISGLFLTFFFASLLVFTTIFTAVDALGMMGQFKSATGEAWIAYYAVVIPETLYRMAPVASLLGGVFTLGILNRNNELIALFASGMSLTRVCLSMLVWVVGICAVVFVSGDRILPQFAKQKNYIYFRDIKHNPSLYSTVKTNKIWYRSKDAIFYIKTLNEKAKKAQGLTLYYFDESWNLIQMITAREVDLKDSTWKLHDGSVTLFAKESSFPLTSDFKMKTIVMTEDAKDLSASGNTSDVLTLSELTDFIQKNKEAGLDTLRYEVDYHSKFGFSLAPLIMLLLGIPFSVVKGRGGGLMRGVAVSLGLVFAYWIFYSSTLTLGNYGYLAPVLSAWIPNFVMATLAFLLIRRVHA